LIARPSLAVDGPSDMKNVIINADDFGLHPAVDEAVLGLAAQGLLRSTSVMAWHALDRRALGQLHAQGVSCGLHLDFTSAAAGSSGLGPAYTVKQLIQRTWTRRLCARAVRASVETQLNRFEEATGRQPAFVDGHEHVHQFPVIREALFAALTQRYAVPPALRDTRPRQWRGTKAAIIGALGGAELAYQARRHALQTNLDFAGVYGFQTTADLPALWRGWLATMPRVNGLIMCHPAVAPIAGDPIAQARVAEHQFMAQGPFRELLAEQACKPHTF
jgi:predicted glycoside hydrolase/deacetylase ChbG (UPF0249 family)